jgi:hypothetical protein
MWKQGNKNITDPYDTIILAVGFGLERDEPGAASYWADIPIDMDTDRERKVLVSGSGDGATTDLMRACLLNFRHDEVITRFASAPCIEEIKERIVDIENSLESGDARFLSRKYEDPSLNLGLKLQRARIQSSGHRAQLTCLLQIVRHSTGS